MARTAYYDAAAKMLAGKPFKGGVDRQDDLVGGGDGQRADGHADPWWLWIHEQYPVARHYRDSKILGLVRGTTEVQLMLIARELGLT